MVNRGVATFGLDGGKCPRWLFSRMVRLSRAMIEPMVEEYGPDEVVRRVSDPVWFQSLGTALAFDWNASGLTTTTTGALKEAIKGREERLGIFICGGKGGTSRKTPSEIEGWKSGAGLSDHQARNLVYNSRLSAKVDSGLVQDGFQIYHHTFFFSASGTWSVVQQGMNVTSQMARRYHWHSSDIENLIEEPHTGIASDRRLPTLDLTSSESSGNRDVALELAQSGRGALERDLKILSSHASELTQMISAKYKGEDIKMLNVEKGEFYVHPVEMENFLESSYLKKIMGEITATKPSSYEELLSTRGVGPKSLRAISLVAEIIYGAEPSYRDPARYAFAHGGKDGTPYKVDKRAYDDTISVLENVFRYANLDEKEKAAALSRLRKAQK